MSWGIELVLFAITKSWRISQYFVLKMVSAAYIQVHFRGDLIMEVNTVNPDQTASREQSDLGRYSSP